MTYSVADGAGNTASGTQTITVTDALPPVLTVPPDLSIPTGPGNTTGTVVVSDVALGTAIATDNSGAPLITRSGVPAGNVFPAGSTTILWTATDVAGNATTQPQVVAVVDTTPPVLATLPNLTVPASGVAGAVVTFSASATDNVTAAPTIVCAPLSGSAFPIGTSTVTCTATDAAGNAASTSFTVRVGGAEDLIRALLLYIDDQDLRKKYEQKLSKPLEKGLKALDREKVKQVCDDLDKFLKDVRKQKRALTVAQATKLDADARVIQALLGC